MATLTGQSIASSYEQLLSLPDGGGNGTTAVAVTDGDAGNTFALQVATDHIVIDSPTASSSTEGGRLRLQCDDGAVMASGHRLGVIEFAGAEDTSSTINVGARIEALCDATWSASENGADLVFYTTDADASQSEGMRLKASQDLALAASLTMVDDEGIVWGTGGDIWMGLLDGENDGQINKGATQGYATNEGRINFHIGAGSTDNTNINIAGGEDEYAILYFYADQGDDSDDIANFRHNKGGQLELNFNNNTVGETFRFDSDGNARADAGWVDNQWDYAEFFEWKTELSDDDAVKDMYGMSVVLDGDKIRLAEVGEEDKILGVIRPRGTGVHGDGLKWKDKYVRNVWNEYEMEDYTNVAWDELGANGRGLYRHGYHQDEIPAYRLRADVGRDKGWHTKESNFELNKEGNKVPVVVPSTDEEKAATNFKQTTGKRRKYSDSYDPSIPYTERKDRPKEWAIVGLLGQVPVRTSAVIPSHWVKQKNLESGIDFYYIYNK